MTPRLYWASGCPFGGGLFEHPARQVRSTAMPWPLERGDAHGESGVLVAEIGGGAVDRSASWIGGHALALGIQGGEQG